MSIESFLGNLFTAQTGGARKSRAKSHYSVRKVKTPKTSPTSFSLGIKRKGRDGKMYQVGMKGNKYVWERCVKSRCSGMGKSQSGPSNKGRYSVARRGAEADITTSIGGAKKSKSRKSKKSKSRKSKKSKSRKSKKSKSRKSKKSGRKSRKSKKSGRKSPKSKKSGRKSRKSKKSM
jgi:hypothetical protein